MATRVTDGACIALTKSEEKERLLAVYVSNFIALIPTRSVCQILAYFFWSRILKDCIEVQEKEKEVVVLCSRPPQNVNLGRFTT